MTINQIITKYYKELQSLCKDDIAVANGKTEYDLLNDVCLTALRKYKNIDVPEYDGKEYLFKTLIREKHFQYKRIDKRLIFTDNLERYISNPE